MQNMVWNVLAPLIAQAADEAPRIYQPWQQNFIQDSLILGFGVFLLFLIWVWARSGRSKREKDLPFSYGSEDFAGTIQAGYGKTPTFLLVVWSVAAISLVAYAVVSVITGVQY